jgi:hypothetical protein
LRTSKARWRPGAAELLKAAPERDGAGDDGAESAQPHAALAQLPQHPLHVIGPRRGRVLLDLVEPKARRPRKRSRDELDLVIVAARAGQGNVLVHGQGHHQPLVVVGVVPEEFDPSRGAGQVGGRDTKVALKRGSGFKHTRAKLRWAVMGGKSLCSPFPVLGDPQDCRGPRSNLQDQPPEKPKPQQVPPPRLLCAWLTRTPLTNQFPNGLHMRVIISPCCSRAPRRALCAGQLSKRPALARRPLEEVRAI